MRHGYKVDSVQCIYSLKGKTFDGPHHGGSGGGESVFWLLDGEYIIGFQGRSGYELDAIQFFTSRGELPNLLQVQWILNAQSNASRSPDTLLWWQRRGRVWGR